MKKMKYIQPTLEVEKMTPDCTVMLLGTTTAEEVGKTPAPARNNMGAIE